MNQQDLEPGKPFNYKGSFKRLNRHPLQYFTGIGNYILDMVEGERYEILNLNYFCYHGNKELAGFIINRPEYGNITMLYSECELKKDESQPDGI